MIDEILKPDCLRNGNIFSGDFWVRLEWTHRFYSSYFMSGHPDTFPFQTSRCARLGRGPCMLGTAMNSVSVGCLKIGGPKDAKKQLKPFGPNQSTCVESILGHRKYVWHVFWDQMESTWKSSLSPSELLL
jgi:hypothetical protein